VKGLSKKQLLEIIEKQSAQLKKCEEQIAGLQEALKAERIENELLRQKIHLLVRRLYGPSSEKMSAAQPDFWQMLEMIDEDMPSGKAEASSWTEEAASQPRRRAPQREQRWPENLPVVEQIIDPEEVKAQPEAWRCIGQEVSERLDYEPARFLRRRLIRRKYVSRKESLAAPVIARLPAMLQERSLPAAGLLAQIIVSKYCDHVPLYRQEQIYWTRHRVWLPRQSQARWMGMVADWFQPIYEAIRTGVMAGGYVQVDETPVHYLCPGHGKTKIGYFWTASRPGGDVVYLWQTSRGAACLDKVLPVDFKGTVQCDAYPAYASFARRKEHLQLAGCWAHARRKFYEARDQDPRRAATARRRALAPVPAHPGATPPSPDPLETYAPLPAPQRPGPGHRLCVEQLEAAGRLPGGWPHRDRPEPRGKCHPAHRPRQEELVVHRPSRGWGTQRHPLHHRGILSPSRA
jgi:transposase